MMPQSTLPIFNYSTNSTGQSSIIRGVDDSKDYVVDKKEDAASLGKDDFLKLLIAQLKNQDPLNPADNTEFVAQLAQFSTLEQMTQMNESLEKNLTSNTAMTEAVTNAMVINYFGKNVTAETDAFYYNGDDPAELHFELEQAAYSGTLQITDTDGNYIASISLGEMGSGENTVEWDCMTNYGVNAQSGEYLFSVKANDYLGNEMDGVPLYYGKVDGVSIKSGVAYLDIGGVKVSFDKIRMIKDSE